MTKQVLELPYEIDKEIVKGERYKCISDDWKILFMEDETVEFKGHEAVIEFTVPVAFGVFGNIVSDEELIVPDHLRLRRLLKDYDPNLNDNSKMVMFDIRILD